MHNHLRIGRGILRSAVLTTILFGALSAGLASAQPHPATPVRTVSVAAPVASDKDVQVTQEELIRLLKLSPTLTTVVARDPSLLSDQEYVRRNNPQLGQFLDAHPEVTVNPDYYLFTHFNVEGRPDQALEHEVWPDLVRESRGPNVLEHLMGDLTPFLVFLCILSALLWLTRMFVDNRRWSRIFKMQTDVHGKLIDRFGSNEELLTYMGTDAGKRFLEAAPIPVEFEPQQRVPSAVARVLNPLQIGIVLALLGAGFLFLRHVRPDPDVETSMLVIGTLFLMPGVGFILSAGITWILAGRLGLMPERPVGTSRLTPPYDVTERQ